VLRTRALERERQRLEALVAYHTSELAAKNALLEQSNRDLEHFAYVASHDLQEPLRKIQSFSDRVVKQYAVALDEQGRDYLGRMSGAAARMQNLIEALLSLSRVSTKKGEVARIDLRALTQEVLGDLEFRLQSTRGRVDVGDLPYIEGDPVQMRQLLQNLIGNALKFHRPGEPPVVTVSAARRNRQLEIRVEDNGIGFESKDAARVFLPFHRLHGRAEYEGTGIGLTICRKIVERHDGTIRAESQPGSGSRFIVTLPLHRLVEVTNAA
jgi:light-regulated signal transduction histidine kinase (bacteriophytochrome)